MSKPEFFVGIDVSKQHLDVAIAGEDAMWRVSHDAAGLTELCARLVTAAPALPASWPRQIRWMRRSWPALRP